MDRLSIRIFAYGMFGGLVIAILVSWHLGQRKVIRQELVLAGIDLIKKTNSENILLAGPELNHELAFLLSSTTRVARINWGDREPPFGNGKATAVLILTNIVGQQLGIRFRYIGQGKFETLGFWTSSAETNRQVRKSR